MCVENGKRSKNLIQRITRLIQNSAWIMCILKPSYVFFPVTWMHPGEGGSRNGIGVKHSKIISPNSIHELGTDLYIVLLPKPPLMLV